MTQDTIEASKLHSKLPEVVTTAAEKLKHHPKVVSALYGQPLYGTVILSDLFGAVQRSHEFGDSAVNTNSV